MEGFRMMVEAFLGLGSNLGDRQANITRALYALEKGTRLRVVSSLYETEPHGFRAQPLFLNAACHILTDCDPFQLLALVKGIERGLGRSVSFVHGPRVIDIDILLYGKLVLLTPTLTLPHPGLAQRAFALAPLAEIAPQLVHPVLKRTVRELLSKLGLPSQRLVPPSLQSDASGAWLRECLDTPSGAHWAQLPGAYGTDF